jgi:quinolinate synthase
VILEMADYIGSTTGILKYASKSPDKEFIVATEAGIIHQMEKENPSKKFFPAPPNNNCACNDCPHMKRNTLEKLYLCLKNGYPEITVPQHIIEKAVVPIERMLEISAILGL